MSRLVDSVGCEVLPGRDSGSNLKDSGLVFWCFDADLRAKSTPHRELAGPVFVVKDEEGHNG